MVLASSASSGIFALRPVIASTAPVVVMLALVLVVLGVVLVVLGFRLLRRTEHDPAALGPLEEMGEREWWAADAAKRQSIIDGARPDGAAPLVGVVAPITAVEEPVVVPDAVVAVRESSPLPDKVVSSDEVVSDEVVSSDAGPLTTGAAGPAAEVEPPENEGFDGDSPEPEAPVLAAAVDDSSSGDAEPADADRVDGRAQGAPPVSGVDQADAPAALAPRAEPEKSSEPDDADWMPPPNASESSGGEQLDLFGRAEAAGHDPSTDVDTSED